MKVGSLIFCNHKKGFISSAIRFFTRSPFSHVMFSMGEILGYESVFSAEKDMEVLPFSKFDEDNTIDYIVFEWQGVPDEKLSAVVGHLYNKYAGEKYAYLQLLWYVWRWFVEIFNIDIRKKGNWFPDHNHCSELSTRATLIIAEEYFPTMKNKIDEWNINNISPYDLYRIITQTPDAMKIVKRKGFESLPV
jgi:hypothetical protein